MSNELVVAKFGSDIVVSDTFDTQTQLNMYAENLMSRHKPNNLIIISSGAVALGSRFIEGMGKNSESFSLQEKAQLGAAAISQAWQHAFQLQGEAAGGLLVTHNELNDAQEGAMLLRLLGRNRKEGVVPVINENDALSVTELMELATGGDNDGLARHIATKVGADGIEFYTKRGGIYDDNSNQIHVVTSENSQELTVMLQARAAEKVGGRGRGDMLSKHTNALKFSRSTGWVKISQPPVGQPNPETETFYPRAK
ncbi:MAG: hypothetical protein ABIQ64_01465 [Candidatus Saccharimonadales bacterium]